MQDITAFTKKRDSEKSNMTPSLKNFFTPQTSIKRSFTAMNGEESIALKRARKYLGSDDEEEVVASPFFGGKRPTMKKIEKQPDLSFEPTTLDKNPEETTNQTTQSIMVVHEEETQVSESPIQSKETVRNLGTDEEVILDSPTGAIRSGDLLNEFQEDADNSVIEEIQASPGYESPEDDPFPPSPPPSGPTIMPLPSRPQAQNTPILHPGMKKAYTPRPSHSIFPETPTPSPILTSQHAVVVQGWKERFLSTSTTTPKLTNTISSRPMTPLHTPLLRRTPVTPLIRKPGSSNVTPTATKTFSSMSSRLAVEQIEEVSPPRGRSACLDRFRYTPR
jgi:hypothetical protein